MPNADDRSMLERIVLWVTLSFMGAVLYQVFVNTSRITAVEQQMLAIKDQIIDVRAAQTKQDFLHQREMDRMADDLMQHRQATEKR